MEVDIIAVYYGMSVARSLKILRCIQILVAHSHPTVA